MKKLVILFIILLLVISSFTFFNTVQANEQLLNNEMEIKTTTVGKRQEVSILLKLHNTEEINAYKDKI